MAELLPNLTIYKSMDWFLYDNDLLHERVKAFMKRFCKRKKNKFEIFVLISVLEIFILIPVRDFHTHLSAVS